MTRPEDRWGGADMATDQGLVDQLDDVWRSIGDFGAALAEDEWKRPTEVPGWTVQDNLVHITALEWTGLGRSAPNHEIPDGLAHVKNDFGRFNEGVVESLRGRRGVDALHEFHG